MREYRIVDQTGASVVVLPEKGGNRSKILRFLRKY